MSISPAFTGSHQRTARNAGTILLREFSRPYPVDRLRADATAFSIEATPVERNAVATRLDLLELSELVATGLLRREPQADLVMVEAEVQATLVQACVVTLEPVPTRRSFTFERAFSAAPAGPAESDELDLDPEAIDIEPLDGTAIDLGELVVEELALDVDPYPRAPGADAELARLTGDALADRPFAALHVLHRRRN